MKKLIKSGFSQDNILHYGNMFLIGNGHLGYRGTLEEYTSDEKVAFNVVGLYDKYLDKWRESVNMPNPLFIKVSSEDKVYSLLEKEAIEHKMILDLEKAILKRKTEFDDVFIKSERFITDDDTLCSLYEVKSKKDICLNILLGLDLNIYDINGPHFKDKSVERNNNTLLFRGITNEGKQVFENIVYQFDCNDYAYQNGYFDLHISLKTNQSFKIYVFAKVTMDNCFPLKKYNELKRKQVDRFRKLWDVSRVKLDAKSNIQFYTDYSIYHLLILGNDKYAHSIPARGVSGQVYKGAIFWDTEIFMLPFFTLTNPQVAKKLIEYRINTLDGALAKAKEFGYEGAFYAWESQETGLEACSLYNITDAITGIPLRTYFNEKQIHISFDIVYGILNYVNITGDKSVLELGARRVIEEVIRFIMSYSKLVNGKYHLLDVIGPDEYHERVDDNAFTTYMAYYAIMDSLDLLDGNLKEEAKVFVDKMWLPAIGNDGLIEQFKGYFEKEDATIDMVKSRLRCENDYWGFEASKTKVIKQADVLTLLVLHNDRFSKDIIKANYDYYEHFTEHGSSLSASMYSIAASMIGYNDFAYQMFLKSAMIDLGLKQKMFAGGIYIGGTHPASNAGAYLSLIFGMAGLRFNNGKLLLNPCLPKQIKGMDFKINYLGKKYNIVLKQEQYEITEVNDD